MVFRIILLSETKKKKITRKDKKILSDCCEAVIGAIYIDRGYDFVKNFILRIWKEKIDHSDITVLDSRATSPMKFRMETVKTIIEELFVLQTMSDDRSVAQVYIKGKPSKNLH